MISGVSELPGREISTKVEGFANSNDSGPKQRNIDEDARIFPRSKLVRMVWNPTPFDGCIQNLNYDILSSHTSPRQYCHISQCHVAFNLCHPSSFLLFPPLPCWPLAIDGESSCALCV